MNEYAAFCSHTPLMVKWNVHYGVEKEAQSGCSSKPEQKITQNVEGEKGRIEKRNARKKKGKGEEATERK